MKFKKGDKVKIIDVSNIDKKLLKNHIGVINDITSKSISIFITDDESLNSTYGYCGKQIRDSGYWWDEFEIELYNVNKRLS